MRLLLDTHIWLWSLGDPSRLGKNVVSALQSKDNELWISPITLWEVLVLADKNRISLTAPVEDWLAQALRTVPVKEAPVTNEVALETGRFQLPHRDPADRFLVATARVFELTLVTADQKIIAAKAVPVLANR
ncbi:MAG TPA: type II toxin-antitoxin system VapC family toxin [Blastocatellia bacterium]|nr:type II toxin-antitoxin system VapC family toxin [Blastocatellia bacterium]